MLKVLPKDVSSIYAAFVDSEIAPKAGSALQKFFAYSSVFVVQKRAEEFLSDPQRVSQMEAIGVMTQDGFLDMDFLHDMAIHALEKSGGSLEVMGVILDSSDVEKVHNIGRSFAQ